MNDGVAGISLQRQGGRLDAYPEELKGRRAHLGRNEPLAELKPAVARDSLYLFPHVGSWGFSPEPQVWHEFLDWFESLEHVDAVENWASLAQVDGQIEPEHESLPARWYRHALNMQRGELGIEHDGVSGTTSSIWTAHFDKFCLERGLLVLHPHLFGGSSTEVGLARSWRTDGAHYHGINTPDSELLGLDAWRDQLLSGKADLFPQSDELARLTLGGELASKSNIAGSKLKNLKHYLKFSPSVVGRRLFDLDVYWDLETSLALHELTNAVNGDTFGYYDPLVSVTHSQAHCILGGLSVVILLLFGLFKFECLFYC